MDTTIRILYAEDDADGAKLTKMILEKENFEVEIVGKEHVKLDTQHTTFSKHCATLLLNRKEVACE